MIEADSKPAKLDDAVRQYMTIRVFPAQPESYLDKYESDQTGEPRFILDTHLGKLACYLRMMGFDAQYQNNLDDKSLAGLAAAENRILLTRDRRLLMRKIVAQGYCLRSQDPAEQIVEVIHRFALASLLQPFKRCLVCNYMLAPVGKDAVDERLEPLTRLYYQEYKICAKCNRIYWKGSHYERMVQMMASWIDKQEIIMIADNLEE